jgi:uncharacterized protein (TIGR03083 family)
MTKAAVEGLQAIHAELEGVLGSLTEDEWALPTACTGWSVKDLLAHVTSNFKEMIEPTPAPAPAADAVPPKAEEAMEMLVAPRKDWPAADLMAEYERYRDGVFAALTGMQEEPTASMVIPIADLGHYPLHLLANAFCFDHYCHLRHDLMKPAGPIERPLPAIDDAQLRPGIEWMMIGLGRMQVTDLNPVVEHPLQIVLTGPGGGSWTVHPPAAGGDGTLEVQENGPAGVATVTSSADAFVSWGTCRSPWRDHCTLSGDEAYATCVLDALNIV